MTPDTEQAIRAHAVSTYPREACGLLLVVRGREQFRPCRNLAESPNEQFVLAPEDYAAAEDAGEIIAIMHSHPEAPATPSEADRVSCEASGLPWVIVEVRHDGRGHVAAEAIITTQPDGYQAPLVGRPFVHGVLDCFSLVRDWYARERGIALPDFGRRDGWWDDGHSALYMDHFREAGFDPVSGPMEPGDGILMQIRSKNDTPNHAGIYLGDGQMLHHPYGRLSTRDCYGGMWKAYTRLVVRYHQSLTTTGEAACARN